MSSKLDILKIAGLARLNVTQAEIKSLGADLEAILGHVEQLQSVSVDDVEALNHVHGISNVFRPDRAKDFSKREEILRNVPDTSGSFIRVPIIVEQGEEG